MAFPNEMQERMLWEVGSDLRILFDDLGVQETFNLLPQDVVNRFLEIFIYRAYYLAEKEFQEYE